MITAKLVDRQKRFQIPGFKQHLNSINPPQLDQLRASRASVVRLADLTSGVASEDLQLLRRQATHLPRLADLTVACN